MTTVIVITGPSGVGKGTLISELMERVAGLELSVSATTRPPREGEEDGRDYHFLSESEFDRRLAAGEFVEHARYAGHRYGTLRGELDRRRRAGAAVVLEIELQGARQVRAAMPGATQVFIAPPEPQCETLRTRLLARGSDTPDEVRRRMRTATRELAAQEEFRHVVVNDDLGDAVERLAEIVCGALAAA